jgi:hypothetical protein
VATYKLIQDIEAEDHILGPLSLRQFIFALVAVFCYYLCFIAIAKSVLPLLVLFLPIALFCTFFAVPFGRDQPTEVWALAKLRFWFKPRQRRWDQSGVKELVTITVPKKIERVLTNGLSETEVQSRLKALANTLDSRGWVVKNATYSAPMPGTDSSSDRLIDIGPSPQEVPTYDVPAEDDILDESSNPVAHQFSNMITASSKAHRQQLIDELNQIRANETTKQQPSQNQPQYWFTGKVSAPPAAAPVQAVPMVSGPPQPVAQATSADDNALAAQLRSREDAGNVSYARMRTLQPAGQQPVPPQPVSSPAQPVATTVTPPSDPAILSLANNNDLNVSTLAREAYKAKNGDEPPQDEVVVSLH